MPEAAGTIIPTQADTSLIMNDIRANTQNFFEYFRKKSEKFEKRRRDLGEYIKNLLDRSELGGKKSRFQRIREKLTLHYEKWFIKGKFFKRVADGFKRLIAASASSFMKFLKLLLLFSVFPGLLDAIINIFINVAVMFVNILAKHIPRIVMTAIRIITEVLPRAWMRIVEAIFPALSRMFYEWARHATGILKPILEALGNFFGNKEVQEFFKGLGKLIPYFIAIWAGLALIGKLAGPIMKLAKGAVLLFKAFSAFGVAMMKLFGILKVVGSFLMTGFMKLVPLLKIAGTWLLSVGKILFSGLLKALPIVFGAIKGFVTFLMANPLFLVIGAIIGGLILLWKFSGKIAKWLDNVPKFLEEKLGVFGKILGTIFKVITAPLRFIVWAFNKIKSGGIKGLFKAIWEKILEFGAWIQSKIKKVFQPVIDIFKPFFKLLNRLIEPMKPALKAIGKVLGKVWDLIKNTIGRAFNSIKDSFSRIGDWFFVIAKVGPIDYFKAGAEQQEAWMKGARVVREAKEAYGKGARSQFVKTAAIVGEADEDIFTRFSERFKGMSERSFRSKVKRLERAGEQAVERREKREEKVTEKKEKEMSEAQKSDIQLLDTLNSINQNLIRQKAASTQTFNNMGTASIRQR